MKPLMHISKICALTTLSAVLVLNSGNADADATALADQPITATSSKNANIAIAASVEWPTALTNAYRDSSFVPTNIYVGYFDPYKCYSYTSGTKGYFTPESVVSDKTKPACSKKWSGNLLNYATMQTIDIFRWAMTGGSRWVDTDNSINYDKPYDSSDTSTSLVVLRRAYSDGQGSNSTFPVKFLLSTVSGGISSYVNPADLSGLSTSKTLGFTSLGLGMNFRVANTTDNSPSNFPGTYVAFNAAVEVCNASAGLETNCTKYTSSTNGNVAYKPEGLMQQYKSNFRFSIFGYLNRQYLNGNNGADLDGGVMRAPMKNIAYEMTNMGAFVANPDAALATASSVSASGAMNYLDNFGYSSHTYKSHDPVSELYAEVIRYFRGQTSPSPTMIPSSITATDKDGFPVVTDWSSWPATQNWCDKNFVVGIGDVNTHADKNISTADNPKSGLEPTTGTIDALGSSADARTWTDSVGNLESPAMTNLASRQTINGDGTGYDFSTNKSATPGSCCNYNGFDMAGIAYWANTNDVNPNITGTQTVQTYWVDVLENRIYKHRNQFWLAAKYGGFHDSTAAASNASNKNGDAPNLASEWWSQCKTVTGTATDCTNPANATFPIPDNYYPASDAAKMVSSLASAFSKIKSETAAATGVTGSSNIFPSNTNVALYQTKYNSDDWSGDLTKLSSSGFSSSTGDLVSTQAWSARDNLTAQFAGTGWNSNRRVVTFGLKQINTDGTEVMGPKPFRLANLTSTELATLGTTTTDQQNVLNYLRGDKSLEGSPYRKRTYLLGDIVNSQAVVVTAPNASYLDDYNPGYAAFKTANASRAQTVYFGANDGMLHALRTSDPNNTTTISDEGKEMFAYVPSYVFQGPFTENPGVAQTDGIAALSSTTYSHHYYVDSTPAVRDIDFNRAGSEDWTSATTSDWHTILVGGLGKGGKMYYAIDVTTPVTSSDSETTVAGKLLWEFTDPDLGYSYGEPLIVKTERWGWVVVFSSGYNNSSGIGTVFIVNPKDGSLIQKVQTSAGSATSPTGLTQLTGFTQNYSDFMFKTLYGGDLLGNVWRFDLPAKASVSSNSTVAVTKIATVTDGTNVQPITVPPWVDIASDGKRYVFVGTGSALDSSDVYGTGTGQQQSFYAFRDGTASAPYTSSTLPSGKSFPLTRSDLTAIAPADLVTGASSSASSVGWYVDLAGGTTTTGKERVIQKIKGNSSGVIGWIGDVPSSDPCTPGWVSYEYVVDMATGKSVLRDATTGDMVSYLGGTTSITSLNFARVGNGVSVIVTDSTGKTSELTALQGGTQPKLVNWRTIGE